MKHLVALLLVFGLAQAHADTLPLLGVGAGAPAAGYTGPGDIVASAKAWWGLRAYTAAKRGTKAVQLCNVGDANCVDINSDATTGLVPNTPTVGAITCGSGANQCTIKIWYDQSGTGSDETQNTAASRANFTPSCTGLGASTPCATFGGSAFYVGATNITQAQPITAVWAAERTGAFTTQANVLESAGSGVQLGYWTSTSTMYGYFGTVQTQAASDSAWHAIQVIGNGASGSTSVDSTTTSSQNMSTNGFSAEGVELSGGATARFITATAVEFGFWGAAFSGGNLASMSSNIHTFWGF